MIIYPRYFVKSKCVYFMIKDGKLFDKCINLGGNVCNAMKNIFNSGLIYNKKYLKAEKNSTQKKAFNVFIYQNIDWPSF